MAIRDSPLAQALRSGDTAPLIALPDQNGVERRSDGLGGKALVLFFYPKDDTPGCTMEACAFRDSFSDLQALGAEVWGVSGDDASSHQRFNRDRLLRVELACVNRSLHTTKIHFVIVGLEDVGEAALREATMQRHLAAFEALDTHAGTSRLALAAAASLLA